VKKTEKGERSERAIHETVTCKQAKCLYWLLAITPPIKSFPSWSSLQLVWGPLLVEVARRQRTGATIKLALRASIMVGEISAKTISEVRETGAVVWPHVSTSRRREHSHNLINPVALNLGGAYRCCTWSGASLSQPTGETTKLALKSSWVFEHSWVGMQKIY
jgi:hypothetical protein